MTVGKAIYYLLTNSTDVTDIVSTRVYPEIAEQNAALPYVVYNIANNEPTDTKPEPSKLDTAQIEVNVYSESYTECIDLSVAVRAALDRVKGTYNGVNVQSIQYLNEIIDFDEPQRAYNIASDYDVRISRSGFEIAQGSPITGVELGELSDVNVTGVTDNQVLSYDAATDTWVPAIDAGGASELSDLSDVNTSLPSDGEVLIYSGGEFVNDNIAISNVTGLQAALDAAPDNLRELSDVTITTPTTGDYLYYNGADWINQSLIVGRNGVEYTGNYDSEAETLLDGATATVELYYTAQADGDGLHEDAQSDTPTSGYDIQRKLYYAEKAQADPDTSADWTQFTAIADNTTYANAKAALLAYLKERTGGTVPISLKMTWEEVAQAPSFTGLLNESYGSGAEAAYSTRRLNGNVTECMVIRRASDSTTTTIGFDGSGNIDESAITTFCTGTTCTVVTWKDQSGNGNDATAAASTNEPTIYTGGALVKENGKVAVQFDGSDDGLTLSSLTYSNDLSLISLYNQTSGTRGRIWCDDITGQQGYWILFGEESSGDSQKIYINDGAGFDSWTHQTAPINQQNLLNIFFTSSLIVDSLNGTAQSQSVTGFSPPINLSGSSSGFAIGNSGNMTHATAMKGQEFILYNSDKSSVRTSIESNIGDYFTQNTPLLDTYSGAAAAYSLRLLDSSYVGSAVEVYNGSSYADIGFNVFGELDTVALAAHCGSNNGFVSKWYDQSGNSNTAAQATTSIMPKIYDGTTGVVTENGKPAVDFNGSGQHFIISDFINPTINEIYSAIGVARPDENDNLLMNFTDGTELLSWSYGRTAGTLTARTFDGTTVDEVSGATTISNQFLAFSKHDFSTPDTSLFIDGVVATGTNAGRGYDAESTIGDGPIPSLEYNGVWQELIIYPSDQSSNRTNIEDNINTFYSIY